MHARAAPHFWPADWLWMTEDVPDDLGLTEVVADEGTGWGGRRACYTGPSVPQHPEDAAGRPSTFRSFREESRLSPY